MLACACASSAPATDDGGADGDGTTDAATARDGGGSGRDAGRLDGSGPRRDGGRLDGARDSGARADGGDAATADAGGADAGPPPADELNPESVYIFGTLEEGLCSRSALAAVEAPNDPLLGFDCDADGYFAAVRPTDGRLIYEQVFDGIREFHCDVCDWTPSSVYPESPLANDDMLSFGCGDDDVVYPHLVAPDGDVVAQCGDAEWRNEDGEMVHDGGVPLLYLGFADSALVRGTTEVEVLWLDTGERQPVSELATANPVVVRAVETPVGFDVAVSPGGDTADQLWRIDARTGDATLIGSYPDPPAITRMLRLDRAGSALDGEGRLYQRAEAAETSHDIIIRRSLDGVSEVVYTEASDPVVKLRISSLVTGP